MEAHPQQIAGDNLGVLCHVAMLRKYDCDWEPHDRRLSDWLYRGGHEEDIVAHPKPNVLL
jgi:hypothetical protein